MAERTIARHEAPAKSTGTAMELGISLFFLVTTMWATHATIKGTADDVSGALGDAAAALPGVVAATLLTGASIGHAAGGRFRGPAGRLLGGLGLGLLFGLASAAGIRFGYGSGSSIMVLAVTVGVASVVGGALAGLPDEVLEAGLWATGWVFFAGVILGVLQLQILNALGGGPTADAAAQATANTRFTYGQSVVTGLIAVYFLMQKLRREPPAWLWFPVVGALPGLILAAAEALTRLGGSSLAKVTNSFSPDDPILVSLNDAARLRHALIVAVVGAAVTALVGIRVVRRSDDD